MLNSRTLPRLCASMLSPCLRSNVKPIRRITSFTLTSSRGKAQVKPQTFGSYLRPGLQSQIPFPGRSGLRSYNGGGSHDHYAGPSNWAFNRTLTWTCVGTAIGIYAAWDFADRGVLYTVLEKQRAWLQAQGVSVPRQLNTQVVKDILNKYFLLHGNDPSNYLSWIGSAFSHQNLWHAAINLMVWSSFARLLFTLPRGHYAAILFGSMVASSATWLFDAQSKGAVGAALGSSGIVSGVMMTATMFYPTLPASVLGIIPAPLWLLTCGFLALDYYIMLTGEASPIGHSAHLGGAAFGLFYYTIFLRKYGGILGPKHRF